MTTATTDNSSHRPPSAIARALLDGEPVDLDQLRKWYAKDAPEWIRTRGIPMDIAVFVWSAPEPKSWAQLSMMINRTGNV